ncbi:dTDP-glucose 4,6-dehydratase 2 [Posidoniimonas polymericola]|uniref:dTDP-glucose 4,6-dehydratase n=1 Tax=Posidoniimonas polymericola TaxID=2528002 RepID=A0A5C5ZFN2_9BACT|nr:dTDP-glucose 4,6-dehydratase [Posidoniimonas polymericola]TWT85910.1 dTDP-glucose 4,6-dehydratase 2 [Posidoniimonas polymericola]
MTSIPSLSTNASPVLLITGGAGFIGSNFVRVVLETTNATVVNLDLLTYAGNPKSLQDLEASDRYRFVQGNIGDGTLVQSLLREHQPSAVINFAAESHVDRSIDCPDDFIQTNVVGTARLLQQCQAYWESLSQDDQRAFRFLHVSTDEVYGSLGAEGYFTEDSRYEPNSPYSASKAASDHLARAYHETFGLPTVISNCSNNYGPYQFPEKLIPLVTLNAIEGKEIPVYGDGLNIRDWLFVTDHCHALLRVLAGGRPGEVYNIGGDAEQKNIDVVKTICKVVDELCPALPHGPSEQLIRFVKDRPGHDRRYAIDASKIKSELGWSPTVTFEQGIRETVRWYLENGDWLKSTVNDATRSRRGLGGASTDGATRPQTRAADRYTDGPIDGVVTRPIKRFSDSRGWLMELFREDDMDPDNRPVMAYFSQTEPGVTRGPHEHVDQADYFAFIGPGDFKLYLWDSRPDSPTYGNCSTIVYGESNPAGVIVPVGVVHAYKNVSDHSGWVFNGPNRLYAGRNRAEPVDEIRHEDQTNSPYKID